MPSAGKSVIKVPRIPGASFPGHACAYGVYVRHGREREREHSRGEVCFFSEYEPDGGLAMWTICR